MQGHFLNATSLGSLCYKSQDNDQKPLSFLLSFNIFPCSAFFCLLEENSAVSCTLHILFLKLIHVETVHKHSALEKAAECSPAPKPPTAGVHVPELHRWTSISCSGALRLAVTNSRCLWRIKIFNNEITIMTIVLIISLLNIFPFSALLEL